MIDFGSMISNTVRNMCTTYQYQPVGVNDSDIQFNFKADLFSVGRIIEKIILSYNYVDVNELDNVW